MKYIIIGLGNYGHVLAEEFSALGHEVIGADISAVSYTHLDVYKRQVFRLSSQV